MSDVLPYRIEYSNGKSVCGDCKTKITNSSVQLAVMQQSTTDDCMIAVWYDQKCFFKIRRPLSETLIDGFANLRYNTQIEIRSCLGINVAAPKRQAKKRKIVSNVPVQMPVKDFAVQYLRTDTNACQSCEENINENALCVMKICHDTVLTENFSSRASWYHLICFMDCRTQLGWLLSGEHLPGFKRLNEQDKEMVKNHLTAIDGTNTEHLIPTKKSRTEFDIEADQAFQGIIKKQNKDYFELRDNIEKHVSQKDRLALLKANNQEIHDENDILDHLTDVICFGLIKPCTECNGQFVFKNLRYRCTGSISEWSNCNNKVKEPERIAVEISTKFQKKYPFLKKTFKVRARILKTATDLNDDDFTLHAMQPLFNMEFFVFGETIQTHDEIEEKIKKMGGKLSDKIHSKLAAVISNVDELQKMGKEMIDAQAFGIQVISEQILDDVKMSDPIALITQNDLSKWGKNPKQRLPKNLLKNTFAPKDLNVQTTQNITWKSGSVVDPESDMESIAHIYEEAGLAYSAILDLVDINANKNSYHKIQLLEQNSGNLYWVFESKGRIATSIGSKSSELFTDFAIAREYFTNKYLELTGNVFGSEIFVKLPGKYNQIKIEYETVNQGTKPFIPSTLSEPVLKLMELLFDVNMMKSALVGFNLDISKMPLGQISKHEINNAWELLGEISLLLENNELNSNKILATSNQFYSQIPHSFGTRRPPIINTEKLIQEKFEMLDAMSQMEIAYGIMTENSNEAKNPFDHYYENLNIHIEQLDKSSSEYDEIQLYVQNTEYNIYQMYTLELQEVFKVCRIGEAERFKCFEKNNNRQLLFHGSPLSNFAAILSNGLKIAPPGVRANGKCFGNGLYFADAISKSSLYCKSDESNNIGLVLLYEVAVGNCHFRYEPDNSALPSNNESVKCCGYYYPYPIYIRDDGLKIPNGKMHISNIGYKMDFNEFIVYNESQAKMRYLIKLKFNPINKPNQ